MNGYPRPSYAAALFSALFSAFLIGGPAAGSVTQSSGADASCSTTPPPGYWVEVGHASGPRDQALNEAYEIARERLLRNVCAGLTEMTCASVQRHVTTWEEQFERRQACVSVAIPREHVDLLRTQARDLDGRLAALAGEVAAQRADLVRHEAPQWASGCSAGVLGTAIRTELDGFLGRSGVRICRDGVGEGGVAGEPSRCVDADRLQLVLSPRDDGVKLMAYMHTPGVAGEVALPGPRFPLDLFALQSGEAGDCVADHTLQLQRGARAGDEQLQVWVDLPRGDNVFEEGAEIEPIVRVNRPARVRVFSVTRSGEAFLIWPYPGIPDVVDAEGSVGKGFVIRDPVAGDESLVAIAVPAGESFGPAEGWLGYCRVEQSFSEGVYPAGAAVGRATYTVVGSNSDEFSAIVEAAQRAREDASPCRP